ncbi:MAG: MurT ligase domain-containing protein, partial [Oscillospiraceae bacterium]
TGSNGKTSVTEMICEAARAANLRVISNSEGSNQIEGVATALLKNCNLKKVVQADVVVLESDERFCQYTFSKFAPTHMVITNLFRDQLTRNGNPEFVFGELEKGVREETTLILNADDPLTARFGIGKENAVWFGVDKDAFLEQKENKHAYFDGAFCPVCKARMKYSYAVVSHLGGFECTSCGFTRACATHSVTAVEDGRLILDKDVSIKPQILNTIFAYNIAAAFTAAVEALGLTKESAAKALDGYSLKNDRIRSFSIEGHRGLFLLSKHENSMSYNGSLNTIVGSGSEKMTVVLIVDLLSRKYIANDMSWLWDIDFELLCDERVERIIVGGQFAGDMGVRLLFAGIPKERLTIEPNIDSMMASLCANPIGDIYAMTCFTDVPKFTKRLKEGTENG